MWYLPTGLVVTELSNALPSNAGVMMWTNVALRPLWSFFIVFITLLLNIAGLASCAALVTAYVVQAFPDLNPAVELAMRVGCLILAAVISAKSTAGTSFVLQVVTLASTVPFFALSFIQLRYRDGISAEAISVVPKGVNLSLFLTYLAFTHSGVENIGSLVEDTKAPEKTFHRAIVPAMFASFFVYLLPFACAITGMAGEDAAHGYTYAAWRPGFWSHIALVIGGSFWSWYVTWAGVLSRFSSLLGTTTCSGRLLAGMGSMDLFPRAVSDYVGQYAISTGTPINGIVVMTLAAAPFSVLLSVDDLVVVFQVLSSVRTLIAVYGSFFVLRVRFPNLPRPYRVPCSTAWGFALLLPSMLFMCAVIVWGITANVQTFCVSIGCLTVSLGAALVWSEFIKPQGLAGRIEEFNIHDAPQSGFLPGDDDDNNEGGECDASLSGLGVRLRRRSHYGHEMSLVQTGRITNTLRP
jgi:polyamine:H+ symporter